MTGGLLLGLGLLGLAGPMARAQDSFLENMRKAATRVEAEERIEYYSRAIRAWKPSHSRTLLGHCHMERGAAFFDQNDPISAAPDLDKAIAADPAAFKAYFVRGRLRLRQGKARLAAADLTEFISLRPEDPAGPLAKGEALEMIGDWTGAETAYLAASSLVPENPRPIVGLARLKKARRRLDEALALLDRADASAGGKDWPTLAERGRTRALAGRTAPGLEDLDNGLALGEDALNRLQRARAKPVELLNAQRELGEAYFWRAAILEKQGRWGPALSDLEEACRLGFQASCARAKIAAAKLRQAPDEPEEPARPRPAKKSRRSRVLQEPGERIYAN